MSLVAKCVVCDDHLPNQYAPLGSCCGGYVCKREQAVAIAKPEPRRKLTISTGRKAA